ncbi:hypothetical protein EIP91_007664 [Steccherinum ochraceum]|uniref:Uncharacterized protein n=1 Tax=Steccherinum ochraceum TaxID=92696 RepID=A0A4R0R6B0_9APHY|nr:hypothetical protein EIP91_007664 [Steccherinum ochraceum]
MRLTVAIAAFVAVASTAVLAAPLRAPVSSVHAHGDKSSLTLRDIVPVESSKEMKMEKRGGEGSGGNRPGSGRPPRRDPLPDDPVEAAKVQKKNDRKEAERLRGERRRAAAREAAAAQGQAGNGKAAEGAPRPESPPTGQDFMVHDPEVVDPIRYLQEQKPSW